MLLPGPPGGALNTLYYCTKFVLEAASIVPSKGGDAGQFFAGLRGHAPAETPALPPPKGVMLANFSWASGGMYPRNPSIAPYEGGDAGQFFFGLPGACTRKTTASPLQEGWVLSVFLHPLLGRR